jgi:hypothetical protein
VNKDLGIVTGNSYLYTQWRGRKKVSRYDVRTFQLPTNYTCSKYILSHVWVWLQMGFRLVIGFIGLVQLVIANKDFAVTVLHTWQSSLSSTVLTSHCMVVVSNSGHFPSSWFPKCPRPQLLACNSNSSQQLNPSGSLTHWLLTNQLLTHSPTNSTCHWLTGSSLTDCIENTIPPLQ